MTLASGQLPYNYEHGKGRFRVPNPYASAYPIGASGVLLEQAQFVLTAERRKFLKNLSGGSHDLEDFFIYVNPDIMPSGPYEPKVDGSTLGNTFYPAAAWIITHIQDMRAILNSFFSFICQDTNYLFEEYRAAWLQALYPESPSGFLFATDPDLTTDFIGHWNHRNASEIGIIDYIAPEVLGSSGVIYDIDFAELMFNPFPHVGAFGLDTMHSKRVNGNNDTFNVQQFPIFPAFQKTNGGLITLTGREPVSISQAEDYGVSHVSSGMVRIDGYPVFTNTRLYLGKYSYVIDESTTDFAVGAEGHREVLFGGNVSGSRIFATPTSQSSGVYRVVAKNAFQDFPTTTIESGVVSFWPNITSYWPNGLTLNSQRIGATTSLDNLGYHVFDDALWSTDVAVNSSFGGPNFGYPSGLAIMSPFTGHRLWVRYASQTPFISTVSFGITVITSSNWSKNVGLTRSANNTIYRLHPTIQRTFTSTSGQCRFGLYNDMLDFVTDVTSTSDVTEPNITNQFPLSDASTFGDMWYDPTNAQYWVANADVTGFDFWKFDSTFKYINKYIAPQSSGLTSPRGVTIGGQQYIYEAGSGIFPTTIVDGTQPYDNGANIPEVGTVTYGIVKNINGAPFIGVASFADIMDVLEISGSTHLRAGIYAIIRWQKPSDIFSGGNIYLIRIEEGSNYWEIKSISQLETNVGLFMSRRELLYMAY